MAGLLVLAACGDAIVLLLIGILLIGIGYVLVMQTTMENQVTGETVTTPNTGNTIQNCLFYNNMTDVHNENYRFDITVFNTDNSDFSVRNNHFYFREKTAGGAEVFINYQNRKTQNPIGPERAGFTAEDNALVQSNFL